MTIEEKIKELVLWSSFSCMEDANSWADDAAKFIRENQEALLSALADQRRLREAVRGECIACDFKDYERPTWHVIDDRNAVPLTLRGRVAIVPLDQEGE